MPQIFLPESGRSRTILRKVFVLTMAAMLSGCGEAAQETSSETGFESEYLSVLSEVTELMEAGCGNPDGAISSIRAYREANLARISETVNALNRSYLSSDEAERKSWRRGAQARVSAGLASYAEAYRRLSECLNAAQKWELGAVMSQFR